MATEIERRYAQIGRSLASHLHTFAKERRDEDKKSIAAAQSELCRIWREEQNGKLQDGK